MANGNESKDYAITLDFAKHLAMMKKEMELIKITEKDGMNVVSARELHEFLEVKTSLKDWFPRMIDYGFEEGIDFSSILSESTGGRPSVDYAITIDMAKELSMLQRTDKGKQARRYFINCEKVAYKAWWLSLS